MKPIDPDQQQRLQQLSDYLDNRLDGAERAKIEQLIHEDDESNEQGLRTQLDQMRYLRDSLKQLTARDDRHQLDNGFADRVIEASVRRAIEEGVSSDHPLIRLASQPGSNVAAAAGSRHSRNWNRRALVAVLSIAASIALAVFIARQNSGSHHSLTNQPMALVQNDAISNDAAGSALPPSVNAFIESGPVDQNSVDQNSVDQNLADRNSADENERDKMASAVRPTDSESGTRADQAMESETIQPSAVQPTYANSPAEHADDGSLDDAIVGMNTNASMTKLSAIMVLEVKQTESGRVVGAVRRAMSKAGIQRGDEKKMTAKIAESASQTVGLGDDEMVSMVYLQASAKSVDQFYVNLFQDRAGVQSVSLAIATETPVLELVNAVDVIDATTVTSGSATLLAGEVGPLADLQFAEMSLQAMQGMNVSSGPDFAAQLIVVIR